MAQTQQLVVIKLLS